MSISLHKWQRGRLALLAVMVLGLAWPALAQEPKPKDPAERPPEEAEGAGQIIRKEEAGTHLCAGCLATIYTEGSKGSITPYGRVELDAIYSSRNNNPLDPGQFNGYATAAGKGNNATATLNPRYSVFGIRADRTDGKHTLTGVVEVDFYGQTDNAGNLPPRLRLANVRYTHEKTSITAGMDWTPIMALHPDLIDFSIMGYGGNLWQRLPQVTVRHQFTQNVEGLLTVMRFERGLSACCGNTQVRPVATTSVGGGSTNTAPFNDPVQHPYYGGRLAYSSGGSMIAASVGYRYYRSAPITGNASFQSGQDINSYLVGAELVHPLTKNLKFSGEIAYGQALGVEFFRFNQELNLTTGKPIRTLVGWGQMSYAPSGSPNTFLVGYGFDNPNRNDLRGSTSGDNIQYLSNQRMYLTWVRPIWADFYFGAEFQNLWTQWTTQERFSGQQYNMSVWYNF